MAGWAVTGDTTGIDAYLTSPDAGRLKSLAFPTLAAGNTAWWQDFSFDVIRQFARRQKQNGQGTTLQVTWGNGSGDAAGVGVLTIVLTVA